LIPICAIQTAELYKTHKHLKQPDNEVAP